MGGNFCLKVLLGDRLESSHTNVSQPGQHQPDYRSRSAPVSQSRSSSVAGLFRQPLHGQSRRILTAALSLLLFLLSAAPIYGQFVGVSPGARAVGLGGSLVASADDASALFWNPARLMEIRQPSLLFDLSRTHQLQTLGASVFDPLRGVFAIALWETRGDARTQNGAVGWAKSVAPGLNAGFNLALASVDSTQSFCYGMGFSWSPSALPGKWKWLNRLNDFAHTLGRDLSVGIDYAGLPVGPKRLAGDFRLGISYLPVAAGPRFHVAQHFHEPKPSSHSGVEVPLGGGSQFFFGMGDFNIRKMGVGFRIHWHQVNFDIAYSAAQQHLLASFQLFLGDDPLVVAERHFTLGSRASKEKNYRTALKEFNRAVAYNPNDRRSWSYSESVRRFLAIEDAEIDSMFQHAEALRQSGDFVAAALEFSRILDKNPDHAAARRKLAVLKPAVDATVGKAFQMGVKLYEDEQYEKAREIFERVLIINPGHSEAQDYLSRTKAILHTFAEDHFLRGLGFYRQRNLTRAYEEFGQAVSLDPEYAEAKSYLDKVGQEKQNLEKMVDQLLREGETLADRGNAIQASIKFRKVLEVDNGNRQARDRLMALQPQVDAYIKKKLSQGKEALARGNLKTARAAFREVLTIVPTHKEATKYDRKAYREMVKRADEHYQNGLSYLQEENYDKALQEFERALVYLPNHAGAKRMRKQAFNLIGLRELLSKAEESYSQGDYVRSMAMFTQILESDPDNATALQYVEKCQQRLNELAESHFNRGISLYAAEDYMAAIEEMNKTLEINPNHRGAKEYKRRAEMRLRALRLLR